MRKRSSALGRRPTEQNNLEFTRGEKGDEKDLESNPWKARSVSKML
jgi:hypothetical protein